MKNKNNILVLAEMNGDTPSDLTQEMLGCGRQLVKESQSSVPAVVFGNNLENVGQDLISFGADQVFLVNDMLCDPYQADAWLPDMTALAKETKANLILMGHNSVGGDLAPRLAFYLKCGIATSCEAIEIKEEKTLLTRTCYGGKAREVLSFGREIAVATVRPKSQKPIAQDRERSGKIKIIPLSAKKSDIRIKVIEHNREDNSGLKLEDATIIVSGGGGLGGPEGFKIASSLAAVLGGAVGASRVACDRGWCPAGYQIGLSGKTVAPELYFAVGISGASHHMAGCANAKNIVAINNDPNAPMFNFARFGAVADFEELVPALTEHIAKLKTK